MDIYAALLVGLLCAGAGGELFVRGTVGLARSARISPGIIAVTVAAFATSSPELTVGITSAMHGEPEISLGDVLGSNVVNIALVLGLALPIASIAVSPGSLKRDFPVAFAVFFVLALLLADGELSRIDAILLLGGFVAWLTATVREARSERSAAVDALPQARPHRALIEGAIGLALLIAAGKLIVFGATGIAHAFGLSDYVIGATVVAVGTSVPELATAVISSLRGHDEVGLGTLLGSNIYNSLFITGVAAMIKPIKVTLASAAPALAFGAAALALTYPRRGMIERWRGGFLLGLYAAYVVVTLRAW